MKIQEKVRGMGKAKKKKKKTKEKNINKRKSSLWGMEESLIAPICNYKLFIEMIDFSLYYAPQSLAVPHKHKHVNKQTGGTYCLKLECQQRFNKLLV